MLKYRIFIFIISFILFNSCDNDMNPDIYIYEWTVSRYNDPDVQEKTHNIFKMDSLINDTIIIESGKSLSNNYILQVIHSIESNWKFQDFETDTVLQIEFDDTKFISGISPTYDTYCNFNDSTYKIRNYFSFLKNPIDSNDINEIDFTYTPAFGIFMFDFMHDPDIYKLEKIISIKGNQKKVILDLSHIPILLCDTNQLYFLNKKLLDIK